MINIDDVFSKLKGLEDPMPNGAWQNMRSVLDKQMPVGNTAVNTTTGALVKKLAIALTAAIITSGGLYYFYQQPFNNDKSLAGGIVSFAEINNASSLAKWVTMQRIAQGNTGFIENHPETIRAGYIKPQHGIIAGQSRQLFNTISSIGFAKAIYNNTERQSLMVSHFAPKNEVSGAGANQSETIIETKEIEVPFDNSKAYSFTTYNLIEEQIRDEKLAVKHQEIVTSKKDLNVKVIGTNNATVIPYKQQVVEINSLYYKEDRDTFNKIHLVEKYAQKQNEPTVLKKVDTVQIVKIERVTYDPLNRAELTSLQNAGILPKTIKVTTTVKKEKSKTAQKHKNTTATKNEDAITTMIDDVSQWFWAYPITLDGWGNTTFINNEWMFATPGVIGLNFGYSLLVSGANAGSAAQPKEKIKTEKKSAASPTLYALPHVYVNIEDQMSLMNVRDESLGGYVRNIVWNNLSDKDLIIQALATRPDWYLGLSHYIGHTNDWSGIK